MKNIQRILLLVFSIAIVSAPLLVFGGEPLQKCTIPDQYSGCGDRQTRSGPTCAIELTCADKPLQLGYSDAVCFRATCPGIWALVHKRADQASFRSRVFTYRHYAFKGMWDLKDQGAIESIVTPCRELFLVMPEDLIELKLRDPDPYAAIEVINLGYIKKGSLEELQKWLAYQIYLERPTFRKAQSGDASSSSKGGCFPFDGRILANPWAVLSRVLGLGW
ncbi:MAG: hypothetical protein ACP5LD_11525 [Desulfomonilaceae bacterium]